MSFLSQTTSGIQPIPQKVVIYAPPGYGKTTFGTFMPHPFYLDVEGSTKQLNVNRLGRNVLKTASDVEATIAEIVAARPPHIKTIIIDTADWLESMCEAEVVKQVNNPKWKTVADIPFGAGAPKLAARFRSTLGYLDLAAAAGFHIVLFAHSKISKFESPDAPGPYDRYELKMSKGCGPLLKEWCDALLFGNWLEQVQVKEEGAPGQAFKGVGGKVRKLYCERTAAFDAKNRHGLAAEEPWDIATIVRAYANIGADLFGDFADTRPPEATAPIRPTAAPPSRRPATPPPPRVAAGQPVTAAAPVDAATAAPAVATVAPSGTLETDADFAAAIAGRENDVAFYYYGHKELEAGQNAADLPAVKKQRIVANTAGFITRLDAWLKQLSPELLAHRDALYGAPAATEERQRAEAMRAELSADVTNTAEAAGDAQQSLPAVSAEQLQAATEPATADPQVAVEANQEATGQA